MHCPLNGGDGAEIIVGYVARTLDARVRSGFQRHMLACSRCRECVAAQITVWSALDAWHPVPVSPDFDDRLFRRLAREERGWPRGNVSWLRWRWRPSIPLAAACALLAGAFLMKQTSPKIAQEAHARPKLEIHQVEQALDDMDLLRQLGVAAAPKAGSPEKI